MHLQQPTNPAVNINSEHDIPDTLLERVVNAELI